MSTQTIPANQIELRVPQWRSITALVCKELYLLVPLFIAISVLGGFLLLYGAAWAHPTPKIGFFSGVVLACSMMFAVAAAATRFAMEHEEGTHSWLVELPTRWWWVYAAKFATVILATLLQFLLLLWLARLCTGRMFDAQNSDAATSVIWEPWRAWLWLAPCVIWGTIFSLRLRRPLVAVLVTCAFLSLISQAASIVTTVWIVIATGLPLSLLLGWRWLDGRDLSGLPLLDAARRWIDTYRPGERRTPAETASSVTTLRSLIWQTLCESWRYLAISGAAALLVGSMALLWLTTSNALRGSVIMQSDRRVEALLLVHGLAIFTSAIYASAVFATDRAQSKYRILGAMPVAPGLVWWSRQLGAIIPLLCVMIIIGAAVIVWSNSSEMISISTLSSSWAGEWIQYRLESQVLARELASASIMAMITGYAIGQWMSLFFRSTILAGLVAAIAAIPLWLWGTMVSFWNMSLWTFQLPVAIGLLWTSRMWIDPCLVDRETRWSKSGITIAAMLPLLVLIAVTACLKSFLVRPHDWESWLIVATWIIGILLIACLAARVLLWRLASHQESGSWLARGAIPFLALCLLWLVPARYFPAGLTNLQRVPSIPESLSASVTALMVPQPTNQEGEARVASPNRSERVPFQVATRLHRVSASDFVVGSPGSPKVDLGRFLLNIETSTDDNATDVAVDLSQGLMTPPLGTGWIESDALAMERIIERLETRADELMEAGQLEASIEHLTAAMRWRVFCRRADVWLQPQRVLDRAFRRWLRWATKEKESSSLRAARRELNQLFPTTWSEWQMIIQDTPSQAPLPPAPVDQLLAMQEWIKNPRMASSPSFPNGQWSMLLNFPGERTRQLELVDQYGSAEIHDMTTWHLAALQRWGYGELNDRTRPFGSLAAVSAQSRQHERTLEVVSEDGDEWLRPRWAPIMTSQLLLQQRFAMTGNWNDFVSNQTRIRAAKLILDLLAFRADQGRWPTSIGELRTSNTGGSFEVPVAPLFGRDFDYFPAGTEPPPYHYEWVDWFRDPQGKLETDASIVESQLEPDRPCICSPGSHAEIVALNSVPYFPPIYFALPDAGPAKVDASNDVQE